jgi:ssDNA-binding Zn-finger/Zn-ribbon topoisomerase 1
MLGKMGSGKTACAVREMVLATDDKTTFSNIILKGKKGKRKTIQISRKMIFGEKEVSQKRDGTPNMKVVFNSPFWKATRTNYPDGINVVIDEAHTLMDSRRSMSSENVIMNDFMSLLRRILGDSGEGYGELVLITQIGRRLDVNARELATSIHYHIAHYKRTCPKCKYNFWETNEVYLKPKVCPRCGYNRMTKGSFVIEKWEFDSMDALNMWIEHNSKSYLKHYYIMDIEKYFKFYDTYQWENLISEY